MNATGPLRRGTPATVSDYDASDISADRIESPSPELRGGVLTGTGSFTGILGFLGVIIHSLMSGIFPALLLAANRRKGELVRASAIRSTSSFRPVCPGSGGVGSQ